MSIQIDNDADEESNDHRREKEQQNQASTTRQPLPWTLYGARGRGRIRGFWRRRRVDRVGPGLLFIFVAIIFICDVLFAFSFRREERHVALTESTVGLTVPLQRRR